MNRYILEGVVRSLDGRFVTLTTGGTQQDGLTMEETVKQQATMMGLEYYVYYVDGYIIGYTFSLDNKPKMH